MHRDSGGDWVAYAVWLSAQVYDDADTAAAPEVAAMVALIPEPDKHSPVQLTVVSGLLPTSRTDDAIERSRRRAQP